MYKIFNTSVNGIVNALVYKGKAITYYDEADKMNKFAKIHSDSDLDIRIGNKVKIVSADNFDCEGYSALVIEKL